MPRCQGCKKERDEEAFISTTTKGVRKTVKKCQPCRDTVKAWKTNNKDRVKAYNAGYKEGVAWDPKEHGLSAAHTAPSPKRTPHTTGMDGSTGKACCTCKEWRPLTLYGKLTSHWDGLRNDCNECLRAYRASEDRKTQMTEYNKQYWVETKEAQTESHRQWKAANKDHVNAYQRVYMSNWEKHQRETNPVFKITKNMRCRLYHAVKAQGADKSARTFELVGCTSEELMAHLESKFTEGMSWDNYGEWHVDHIKPCAVFDLLFAEQQESCFHYTNLQPLWGSENISKGATWTDTDSDAHADEQEGEDAKVARCVSPTPLN
jgi:hypothetical protein